ncbi:MAG: serine/threonine protein kinase, partial [Calditrichaeota bacterium]|nr:serine/threonine protein kinase [Calditrichota bacterium]
IARVFAAGTTDKGRPFFAMEYVPGMPLNDYCDTHRLSTSERLDLFVRICSAVQHAHQKGVIHRDLKPSNILVTELDGQAVPKIIDFGIAKAIHTPLTAQSLITAVGEVVGTPAYMSPEQLKAGELDIDTRSDIYSLGVILYELLSGNLPFEAEDYRQPSGALQKILLENDPPTPSRRMSTAGDKARRVAENRRTDAIALRKKLQGDLDWITIKAMEKERTRRYETANGLAVDLKRYLNNEPVSARPPSNAYRLGKFVQRNKLAVGAGAIALAGLLIGLTAAVVGFVRATEAERQALLEAETARRVSDFMVETFRNADPTHTLGDTILASSLIEESVQRISRDLRDQPRIQSRLMQTMGRAYLNLGLYEKGIALLDSTLAKQRRFLGEDDPEFANTLAPLGKAYHELGENEKALSSLQAALGIYRRHNSDFKVIGVLNDLMEYWDKVGDYDSSLAYARKAVDLAEKYPDSPEETVAKAFARMGMALNHTGEYGEAIKWMRRGLDQVTRFHPETNPTVQVILNDLAICLESAGQNEEASRHLHKVVELSEKLWGVDHWQTAISYDNLGNQLSRQGKFDEAITYFRKAGENFRKYYGEDHIDTGINYNNQGFANFQRGDYEEADRLFRASNRILRKVLGDDHPYVGVSCYHLANVQMARKNWSEARRFNDIAIELIRAGMGEKHPRLGIAFRQRGSLNLQTGRYAEAQPALEQAIRIFSEAQPPDSSSLGIAYGDYAEVMRKTGHTRAADSLAALAKTFGGE